MQVSTTAPASGRLKTSVSCRFLEALNHRRHPLRPIRRCLLPRRHPLGCPCHGHRRLPRQSGAWDDAGHRVSLACLARFRERRRGAKRSAPSNLGSVFPASPSSSLCGASGWGPLPRFLWIRPPGVVPSATWSNNQYTTYPEACQGGRRRVFIEDHYAHRRTHRAIRCSSRREQKTLAGGSLDPATHSGCQSRGRKLDFHGALPARR